MSERERVVQVLEVAARELIVRDYLNLAVALLRDLDGIAEVADAAIDLDLLVEELLEGRHVKDLVARWLRGVDDELNDPRDAAVSKLFALISFGWSGFFSL